MAKPRKGKWADVLERKKLPTLPGVEPERRQVVDAARDAILAPPEEQACPECGAATAASVCPSCGSDMPGQSSDPGMILDAAHRKIKALLAALTRGTGGRRYASEFGRLYAEARDAKDRVDLWASNLNVLVDAFEELMTDQMTNEGIKSLTLDNGRPIHTHREPYYQVRDREAWRRYCLADPDLAPKMSVAWGTMNSLAKDMLEKNEEPPDCLEGFSRTVVRLGSK